MSAQLDQKAGKTGGGQRGQHEITQKEKADQKADKYQQHGHRLKKQRHRVIGQQLDQAEKEQSRQKNGESPADQRQGNQFPLAGSDGRAFGERGLRFGRAEKNERQGQRPGKQSADEQPGHDQNDDGDQNNCSNEQWWFFSQVIVYVIPAQGNPADHRASSKKWPDDEEQSDDEVQGKGENGEGLSQDSAHCCKEVFL